MEYHSPSATQPGKASFSAPFFCLLFLGKDAPEGSPLGGQRKVGAAPHRGNANKPISNQGKAKKTKTKKGQLPPKVRLNHRFIPLDLIKRPMSENPAFSHNRHPPGVAGQRSNKLHIMFNNHHGASPAQLVE